MLEPKALLHSIITSTIIIIITIRSQQAFGTGHL